MNNVRRKQISNVIKMAEELKNEIAFILSEEQFGYDNLTEGLQATMRGAAMEDAIDSLEEAMDGLDEVINSLNNAKV